MTGRFVQLHGVVVVRRPLWTRVAWLRRRIDDEGAVIEVERALEALVQRALAERRRLVQLPLPPYNPFEVVTDDDPEWPGLIARVTATYVRIVGRVSDLQTATRLVDVLNRALGEDARRPRTARFWARGTF